jgi:hypothetical protein
VRGLAVALAAVLAIPLSARRANASPVVLGPAGDGNPPLVFQHGYVQQHPKVYLVFWGPKWNSDNTHNATRAQVIATLSSLAGGQYNNILTQYHNPFDTTTRDNFVHNDVQMAGYVTDTSSPPGVPLDIGVEVPGGGLLGVGELRGEAVHALRDLLHVAPDTNTQVMVIPQQGTVYALPDACGMHSYDSYDFSQPFAYSYIRYADAGSQCSAVGDVPQSTAWTAVHEYSEAATDPHIYVADEPEFIHGSGWNTNEHGLSPHTPFEVADLCESYFPSEGSVWNGITGSYVLDGSGARVPWPVYHPANTTLSLYLPFLWSNNSQGCVMSEGEEYASPASPSRHTVQGLVLDKYHQLGASSGGLGPPMSEETPITSDSGGVVSYFHPGGSGPAGSEGAIYYSDATGAHEVFGAIYSHYLSTWGGPAGGLGFPLSDEVAAGPGRANYFGAGGGGPFGSKGAIYYSAATGAHEMYGSIYSYYLTVFTGPDGGLGLPVSDEVAAGPGRANYFGTGGPGPSGSKGALYWSQDTGTHEIYGAIYAYYLSAWGGPGGSLGLPVSDEQAANASGARVNYFGVGGDGPYGSKGALYWSASTGTHEMFGSIYIYYLYVWNGPSGGLGLPVSDEEAAGSGRVNYFGAGGPGPHGSRGALYFSQSTGTHEVYGAIYAKYLSLGAVSSALGFPITDEYTNSLGFQESDFQGGQIVFINGLASVIYNCPTPVPHPC